MGGSGSESKATETYPFAVTLNLNARFMPMDRGVFEDVLDETLRLHGLGEVSGGGTLLSDSGEIEECDIELCLRDGSPELISMIGGLINAMGGAQGVETAVGRGGWRARGALGGATRGACPLPERYRPPR